MTRYDKLSVSTFLLLLLRAGSNKNYEHKRFPIDKVKSIVNLNINHPSLSQNWDILQGA